MPSEKRNYLVRILQAFGEGLFLFLVLFYFVFGKDAITSLKKRTLFNLTSRSWLCATNFNKQVLEDCSNKNYVAIINIYCPFFDAEKPSVLTVGYCEYIL